MKNKYYILDGHTPVPVKDILLWARFFEKEPRHVAQNTRFGIYVSTVFLGLDHNYSEQGPPLIFETMIFDGFHDGEMWRYTTWEEAEQGHKNACRLAHSVWGNSIWVCIYPLIWLYRKSVKYVRILSVWLRKSLKKQ